MFKRILLAVDGSEHADRAAEKAIGLAKLQGAGASVELVYVVDAKKSKSDVLKYGDSDTATYKRKEMLQVYEAKLFNKGIKSETTVLFGSPAETIIEHANDGKYDCLVMGSRGRNEFQTFVLGGVSHKVMKHVKAPVMLVK
ncbi:universal stress protein [Alteribacter natronophilus]|uniref:universal stress protein n=1 Tax=Alteribacter natronophilus TaxID=2583810 RepID=UPI00110F62A4|nr:universal stress protein [Alteribacter natronophilus]TMW70390.1 universal stress protein [Alteribacter natronophilus]